jgi:hypothetical protein
MEGLALEHNEMILLTDSSNEEYRPPIVVNKILISSFSPESNSKYPVGSISKDKCFSSFLIVAFFVDRWRASFNLHISFALSE